MNFFAEQDRAKRNTFWLITLLIAAVICLIGMTVLVAAGVMYFSQQPYGSSATAEAVSWWEHLRQILVSDTLFYAAGSILLLVTCGSLYKTLQLRGGGSKVAEALGGRKIEPNTTEGDERKILNVVEEMAIASGNPVPPVYVIDDDSINAFAAGHDRRNAVIGVTRGCIRLLSRDELQGVIAHEFSHIHNGDMRINLRLVALLHGILIIGLIGSFLLRSSAFGSRNRNRSAQVGLGLAFLVLGYSGIFFGNIIKAAVSRQREFLADASAVQFTRNPDGIANALKKIGGLSSHALLSSPVARQYSHLYFGQGIKTAFGGIMATHPPLEKRIKKVQPHWDGHFINPKEPASTQPPPPPQDDRAATPQFSAVMGMAAGAAAAPAMSDTVDRIGEPTLENLETAQQLINDIPKALNDAAHDPFMARALIYGLLLDRESNNCQKAQLQALREKAHPATFRALEAMLPQIIALERTQHLPLMELAIPALKSQSDGQYQVFKKNLATLIRADKRVSLFEWCLYRIVTQTTEEVQPSDNGRLEQAQQAIETVLSAACFSGKTTNYHFAFSAAQKHLPSMKLRPSSGADVSFQMLDKAVAQLAGLKPLHKPPVLKALAACIQADNLVTPEEAELFRAIADCMDCPVPLQAAAH